MSNYARSFFLLKQSFSFPLSPGACFKTAVSHLIVGSLLYNRKCVEATVVIWCYK